MEHCLVRSTSQTKQTLLKIQSINNDGGSKKTFILEISMNLHYFFFWRAFSKKKLPTRPFLANPNMANKSPEVHNKSPETHNIKAPKKSKDTPRKHQSCLFEPTRRKTGGPRLVRDLETEAWSCRPRCRTQWGLLQSSEWISRLLQVSFF